MEETEFRGRDPKSCLNVLQGSHTLSKVKNRWTKVLGSGQLWKEAVARVALRKDFGKEPSMDEFERYTKKLTAEGYAMLARDLRDDVDKALCKE